MAFYILMFLIGYIGMTALLVVTSVGKPRGPVTPTVAAYEILSNGLAVAGLVYVLTQL